jgi:SPP1 gp7 family putative phage head morphogenesis protein
VAKGVPYEAIEKQIRALLRSLLFEPLMETVKEHAPGAQSISNAGAVSEAIRSGRITYTEGAFTGRFSAAITRELLMLGAKYDERRKLYRIPLDRVPSWVSAEAGAVAQRAKDLHDALDGRLQEIGGRIERAVAEYPIDAESTVEWIRRSNEDVAKKLGLSGDLTPEQKALLARQYTDSIRPYIKDWADEQVLSLRKVVQKNALAGHRFDSLVSGIESRYQVTKSKAKFLARQETAMFMAKYDQGKQKEAGVTRYRWSATKDIRVRHDHKELDGRIFFWSSPPVVDKETGRRAHPGEDFNCRCVPIPLLEGAV